MLTPRAAVVSRRAAGSRHQAEIQEDKSHAVTCLDAWLDLLHADSGCTWSTMILASCRAPEELLGVTSSKGSCQASRSSSRSEATPHAAPLLAAPSSAVQYATITPPAHSAYGCLSAQESWDLSSDPKTLAVDLHAPSPAALHAHHHHAGGRAESALIPSSLGEFRTQQMLIAQHSNARSALPELFSSGISEERRTTLRRNAARLGIACVTQCAGAQWCAGYCGRKGHI